MGPLPARQMEACKHLRGLRVRKGSLIHVERNVYSVQSRLIGDRLAEEAELRPATSSQP